MGLPDSVAAESILLILLISVLYACGSSVKLNVSAPVSIASKFQRPIVFLSKGGAQLALPLYLTPWKQSF